MVTLRTLLLLGSILWIAGCAPSQDSLVQLLAENNVAGETRLEVYEDSLVYSKGPLEIWVRNEIKKPSSEAELRSSKDVAARVYVFHQQKLINQIDLNVYTRTIHPRIIRGANLDYLLLQQCDFSATEVGGYELIVHAIHEAGTTEVFKHPFAIMSRSDSDDGMIYRQPDVFVSFVSGDADTIIIREHDYDSKLFQQTSKSDFQRVGIWDQAAGRFKSIEQ